METRVTLLAKLKDQHDQAAWLDFSNYYKPYLYAVLNRMSIDHHDSEDIIQTVLLLVWEKLPDFVYDPGKGHFRSWLCTVTKNKVKEYLRKKTHQLIDLDESKRDKARIELDKVNLPDVEQIALQEWQNHITDLAWKAIEEQFSEQMCQIFLRITEGENTQELADELGMPLNTIHVYKRRVEKQFMREILRFENELS